MCSLLSNIISFLLYLRLNDILMLNYNVSKLFAYLFEIILFIICNKATYSTPKRRAVSKFVF